METKLLHNNKISKKITAEQTIILIRLIKKYRCIWDSNHPDFLNRAIRKSCFEKIGSYFKLSSRDVRDKYRRFRNSYRQELRQIIEKKKKYPSLFYFDEMDFLREQIEKRSIETSQDESSAFDNDMSNVEERDLLTVPKESNEEFHSLESIEFQLSVDDTNSNQESTADDVLDSKDESITNEGLKSEEDVDENPLKREEDEFDTFAGYLASQLREMDKLSALETMEELQHIVSQKRINILKRNHCI